ncbi:MAG: FAD-dependent oxidoreductase [Verrucomicrobiota bacterium]|nr:FAD-dependent oxidoreductase [Verrucomicrobiota bacterium]
MIKHLCCYLSCLLGSLLGLSDVKSVVILGSGIGGLTSALYLARAGIETFVVEGPLPGGLITESHLVQNWPGEFAIGGTELMAKVRQQTEANGVHFVQKEVVDVDFSTRPFSITLRSSEEERGKELWQTQSCIIATGTTPNFLGVSGEKEYWGRGVSNCAICDGALYRDRIVGVVGGGDAAALEALYLSRMAKKVYLFVRKGEMRAKEKTRVQALLATENVTFIPKTEVVQILGEEGEVTGVLVEKEGKREEISLDGLFLAIGSKPNSQIFQGKVALDAQGYIALKEGQQSSVPGVFAVGDVSDPIFKQAVTAAGDGAKAALQLEGFLMKTSVQGNSVQDTTVVELDSEQSLEPFLHSGKPLLVDFYAPWCGPCRRIAPRFEEVATRLQGKMLFCRVDVDRVGPVARAYRVRSMPTLVLFDATGAEKERAVGSAAALDLLQRLEQEDAIPKQDEELTTGL